MKNILSAVIGYLVLALATSQAFAQEATWEYAVQVSATVQTSPAQIQLSWPQDTRAVPNGYTVYRKAPSATSWGTGTTLPGSTTSFSDSNVSVGSIYEYQIVKQSPLGYTGYGYILAGIQAPLVDSRGKVVLIVDNTYAANLSADLSRLQQDLVGDGWTVLRHDVARTDTPANVKNLIKADYNADRSNVKAVFLFGRVPVLRSGNLNVDGHQARPMPADVFYGDMDGNWTDGNGDGIYDQSYLPSDVELQLGRVDFAKMNGSTGGATWPSELELLRQYLNKDHNFRQKLLTAPMRGLVGDRFGLFGGEAFAASGFRNFSTFFGAGNTTIANASDTAPVSEKWISYLAGNKYLWAYGCGGGSATSMSGLGTHGLYTDVWSTDIVGQDAKAIFNMQFGSWLCDWDTQDNIMRSLLATPTMGLTCSWSGRPHHYYHYMGLGDTAGAGIRLSQNNNGLYQNQYNSEKRGIHIALMGDPTLRMHQIAPPASLNGTIGSGGAQLAWGPSSDSVIGYHIYRAATSDGPFTRLTSAPLAGTSFTDTSVTTGSYAYMARAVKLENTPSGSYYNASQGTFATVNGSGSSLPVVTVQATDANASEAGIDPGIFTITRSGSLTSALTVNYTLGGTASNGADYSALGASASLPAGAASTTIVVTPIDDSLVEGSETVTLTIASSSSYSVGAPNSATVTIADNDSAPALALNTVSVTASDATATIGSTDTGAFTFTRTGDTSAAMTVNYTLDGTAVKWTDYRRPEGDMPVSFTIPAGSASATMTIVAYANTTSANPETVVLSLSADPAYAVGSPSSATITIQNAPAPVLPTITVAATDANASESGADAGTFTITRTGDTTSALKINYTLTGTATAGTDYTTLALSTSLPIGASSATVVVTPIDDSLVEGDETVTLTLATDAAYVVGTSNSATIAIADNDSAPPPPATNAPPATVSVVDYTNLELPKVGDNTLHVLAPNLLELVRINTKQPDPGTVDCWNFVDTTFQLHAPALSEFAVTVDGQPVAVTGVGFKRRALYAPDATRDLRIANSLYLQLAGTVADNQTVEVKNPSGALWASTTQFAASANPLRYSPAIHVNQEGYMPSFPKKAMIGYYVGSFGEMDIAAGLGFKLVDAATGAQVYQGSLALRKDVGYTYTPTPYQKVLVADFSGFNTRGEYRLVVPGLGASLPFMIDDGVAMAFTRAYALGLYHQRCGTNNVLPFTRYTHDLCHIAPASVPSPQSSFDFTWNTIAMYSARLNNENPPQTAPQLKDEASQLFPYVNKGTVDVSGGHHDAGDYSKYTINSTRLIHQLIFAVDALPGVAALDNLGIPESGDGVSDLLQEAKWESDFLAKLQDADGGFYTLVYPQNREYENNVTPDHGDPQVVWPKTTSVTAASVAALAQCASSPRFKQQYPAEAAAYLQKAQLGWNFLMNAITKYGKDGCYQKTIHYGDNFIHNDELAWAACEMFLATGDPSYQQKLIAWFDPSDSATWRWNWWRMSECYGNAIRSFAFAAKSGRLQSSQLDASYLAKCEGQIVAAGDDALNWSNQNAYGSSFPDATKRVLAAGWYFSINQAYDMMIAYQLNPKPEYVEAFIENMNYEGGCNPVNVAYVTGLGWKRQREIVHQYAQNDRRILPPTGIPLGNIQSGFVYLAAYGSELSALNFPQDSAATSPYPFYDRWGDAYNVTTEFVNTDQARSLASLAFLATLTPTKSQPWKPVAAQISVPTDVSIGQPVTASVSVPGMDLSGARIVWEAVNQEPSYGTSVTFTPGTYGSQWVETEIQWPDGRRVFGAATVGATNDLPIVNVTASDPQGSEAGPDPFVFTFTRTGDTANALTVNFSFSGTATKWNDYRRLEGDAPATIVIPSGAASVDLTFYPVADTEAEGSETVILDLASDPAYNLGTSYRATATITDTASPTPTTTPPTINVTATAPNASETASLPGVFTITRTGDTSAALTVQFTPAGTATNGTDYNSLATSATLAVGAASTTVVIAPLDDSLVEGDETVILTLKSDVAYTLGSAFSATVTIADNDAPPPPPTVSVSATDANAAEAGSDPGVFTFTRIGDTSAALTINYLLTGTATKWNDYRRMEGDMPVTITIPAGASSATLTVYPVDDTEVEGSETIVLTIAADPAYEVGSPNAGTVTLADNDSAIPTVTVFATDADAAEAGSDPGIFTFTRTGDTSAALTVNYTLSGTAIKWNDYRRIEGDMPVTITIPAGAASATLTVYPVDDAEVEGNETVILTLAPDASYAVGSANSATVTIADNDTAASLPTVAVVASDPNASRVNQDPGQFTFTRTGDLSTALTVNYSLSGTAIKWDDYRTPLGDMPVSITIPAGAASVVLTIVPQPRSYLVDAETVILELTPDAAYSVGSSSKATVNIAGNSVPISSIKATGASITLTWSSVAGKTYHVAYKNSLSDPAWTDLSGDINATGSKTSWTDRSANKSTQRSYVVYGIN